MIHIEPKITNDVQPQIPSTENWVKFETKKDLRGILLIDTLMHTYLPARSFFFLSIASTIEAFSLVSCRTAPLRWLNANMSAIRKYYLTLIRFL